MFNFCVCVYLYNDDDSLFGCGSFIVKADSIPLAFDVAIDEGCRIYSRSFSVVSISLVSEGGK